MSRNQTEVAMEVELGLVGPGQMIVPLLAGLSYSNSDPYAIRMAFHVGTDKPVEWTLARDLLAAALHGREGIGDVQAWPSAASCDPTLDAAGVAEGPILNIAMTSPFGAAQFEISAQAVAGFLYRTYKVVAAGDESGYLDFDAELAELLSQGLSGPA